VGGTTESDDAAVAEPPPPCLGIFQLSSNGL